ncbi:hypothetical protein GCM10022377_13230 [Zhihengliuella alba]|uniref:FHA domain-containing protein n=1 Tax=Zhihengliuella alba TaxID=547018 RepID=A0ABP7DBT3_9MICC
MSKAMHLVNASAAQRLGAWLLDAVPVAVVGGAFGAALAPQLQHVVAAPETLGQVSGQLALAGLICLAYGVFQWWWEATRGKTVGNVALGLRTTDEDGFAPGWGKTFVRRLIIGLAGIVPLIGPILIVVSNLWDPNHQRQGWHDKVARTLMMDVRAGRDPLATGGLFGPVAFAPLGMPVANAPLPDESVRDFSELISEVPGRPSAGRGEDAYASSASAGPAPAAAHDHAPSNGHAPSNEYVEPSVVGEAAAVPAAPARATEAPAPVAWSPTTGQHQTASPAAAAPVGASAAPGEHPDDAVQQTQFRRTEPSATRLVFDDGQTAVIEESLLIGRNPSAVGDEVADLFSLADIGRSVSKTHLLVQAAANGVWVTDRGSTNGSAVSDAGGERRVLEAGQPVKAAVGDTVWLGDRYFKVERA